MAITFKQLSGASRITLADLVREGIVDDRDALKASGQDPKKIRDAEFLEQRPELVFGTIRQKRISRGYKFLESFLNQNNPSYLRLMGALAVPIDKDIVEALYKADSYYVSHNEQIDEALKYNNELVLPFFEEEDEFAKAFIRCWNSINPYIKETSQINDNISGKLRELFRSAGEFGDISSEGFNAITEYLEEKALQLPEQEKSYHQLIENASRLIPTMIKYCRMYEELMPIKEMYAVG